MVCKIKFLTWFFKYRFEKIFRFGEISSVARSKTGFPCFLGHERGNVAQAEIQFTLSQSSLLLSALFFSRSHETLRKLP